MTDSMAEKLVALRRENGFSQEYVAKLLHVELHFVAVWESGDELPMPSQIRELAALYGVTPSYLLSSDKKEKPDTVSMPAVTDTSTPVGQNEIHEGYKQNPDCEYTQPNQRDGLFDRIKKKDKSGAIYPTLAKLMFVFPFPIFITALYIFLGFTTRVWHPTWMMFMLIPVYYMFACAAAAHSKRTFFLLQPVPLLVTILYLMLGFSLHLWWVAWILFLLLPVYYFAVLIFVRGKRK